MSRREKDRRCKEEAGASRHLLQRPARPLQGGPGLQACPGAQGGTYQAVLPRAGWSRWQSSSRACAGLAASSGDSWPPGSSSAGILHTAAHVRTLLSAAEGQGRGQESVGAPSPPPDLQTAPQHTPCRTRKTPLPLLQSINISEKKINFLKIDLLLFFSNSPSKKGAKLGAAGGMGISSPEGQLESKRGMKQIFPESVCEHLAQACRCHIHTRTKRYEPWYWPVH